MQGFVENNKGLISITVGLQLLTGAVQYLLIPILLSRIIDNPETFTRNIYFLLGAISLYTLLSMASMHADKVIEPAMYEYVTVEIVRIVLESATVTPAGVANVIENMSVIRDTSHDLSYLILTSILPRVVVLLFNVVALVNVHTELGLIVGALLLTSLIVQTIIFQATDNHIEEVNRDRDSFELYLEDLLNNIHIIQSTPGAVETEVDELRAKIGAWRQSNSLMLKSINSNQYISASIHLLLAFVFFGLITYYSPDMTFGTGTFSVLVVAGIFQNLWDMAYHLPALFHKLKVINHSLSFIFKRETRTTATYVRAIENGAVDMRDVSYKYNDTEPIIHNLSLTIEPNTIVSIFGRSGLGKSTLGKLISGILKPTSGTIVTGGEAIYIDQNTASLFDRTVLENILYGVDATKYIQARSKLNNVLKLYNLDTIYEKDFLDMPAGKYGSKLSGGQKKIIYLLRAVCGFTDAPIIILDEPTVGLDSVTKKSVLRLIRDLSDDHTVILISHDHDVTGISHRVIEARTFTEMNR